MFIFGKGSEERASVLEISFRDIFEHHEELPLTQTERKAIREKLEEYNNDYRRGLDLTFIQSLKRPSEKMTNVLTKVIKEKYLSDIRRGDVIRLCFITDMQYGYYFWDGEKIILPERDEIDGIPSFHIEDNYIAELFRVPSVFKIPKEFPLHYWRLSLFVGQSLYGDFSYDTSDINRSRTLSEVGDTLVEMGTIAEISTIIVGYLNFSLEECKINCDQSKLRIYKDPGTDFHIIVEDEKGTMERFLRTGRCFSAFRGEDCLSHCLKFTDNLFRIFDEDNERLGVFFGALQNHIQEHGEEAKSIYVSYHRTAT
jgi:hypothetical protein